MTRRAAIGALGIGAAGLVLMPRRRGGSPAGRTRITYWEKWTGREGRGIQDVVDAFNGSQDRIWVDRVPVSEIIPKAMVAIAGGDPPDVVGLYSYSIPHFAESGAIVAFDEFGGSSARYAPGVARLLSHRGRVWAGVNTCYTLAMYVNVEVARAVGLDPERPARDTDELLEWGAAMTARGAGGGIERAGFLQNIPGWWPYAWPMLFDAGLYDAAENRATIGDGASLGAFEWISRTAEGAGRAASRAFAASFGRSIHSRDDPFISGKLGMVLQGPWLAGFIRDHRPGLEYVCVPPPLAPGLGRRDQPPGMLEADVICIPRGCLHPEEAWAFVEFTQRREVQEGLARAHAKGSPMAERSAGFEVGHPNPYAGVFDAIARSDRVRVLPQTRAWKAYADLITSAFDAVWSGADAGRVLAGVRAGAQSLLDRAAARGGAS